MADLLITTALTQIEVALRDAILGSLGKCLTVADNTALKALASNARRHNEQAYNTAAGYRYQFNRFSTATDNGTTVLKPTDNPAAGRWERTASTSTSGYLRSVDFWEGDGNEAHILARLFGQVPSVLIVWEGEEYTPRSQVPGALYQYRPRFALWGMAQNARENFEGKIGSAISAEATADPGGNRILGDLRALLAGTDLDLYGVDYIEILKADRVLASGLPERRFVYRLDIEVRATIHNPETDLVELDNPRAFDVTRQLGDLHGNDEFDADNYLVSGAAVTVGSGLTQNLSACQAVIDGVTTSYFGGSHTFLPWKHTYRDLDTDGNFTFVIAASNGEVPDVTDGALRIGVTVTDGNDVTEDRILVPTLATFGDTDEVPPN